MTTPLHGGYFFQKRIPRYAMQWIDAVLSLLLTRTSRHFVPPTPKKLLLSQIANLGDLIITTSLLPPLKKALPDLHIGLLIGSWGEEIIRSHPLVDTVHRFDHWKLQKNDRPFLKKWHRHRTSFHSALQEIRAQSYDAALECRSHFPNAIPLLYRAKIPVRLGYTSGGFGPLLTHPVPWTQSTLSAAHLAAHLATPYIPLDLSLLKPNLPPPPPLTLPLPPSYLILHIGSGHPAKNWPLAYWRRLAEQLVQAGHLLLFTGRGPTEETEIAHISARLPRCMNLCNRLSWSETLSLLQGATLLLSGDTSIAHAAAAVSTPAIHLYSGIHSIEEWRPLNPHAEILTHPTPCAPCYQANGCATMACLRHITPEQVFDRIHFRNRELRSRALPKGLALWKPTI